MGEIPIGTTKYKQKQKINKKKQEVILIWSSLKPVQMVCGRLLPAWQTMHSSSNHGTILLSSAKFGQCTEEYGKLSTECRKRTFEFHCHGNSWNLSGSAGCKLVDYKYHMDCFFVCLADPFLESDNAGLKCAVCIALGVITKSTALPLPAGGEGDAAEEVTKLSLVNKLIGMIKTAKETNKVSVPLGLCSCV